MGYVYLSNDHTVMPEFYAIGSAAYVLWVRGICWQSQCDTGGIVPPHVAHFLGGRQAKRSVRELLEAGLWVELPDGVYSIPQDIRGIPLWKPGPRELTRRPIPDALRQAVYDRDGQACLHCGTTESLSLDHIYPYSLGGQDTLDNLQTLCRPCNSRKGARVDGP